MSWLKEWKNETINKLMNEWTIPMTPAMTDYMGVSKHYQTLSTSLKYSSCDLVSAHIFANNILCTCNHFNAVMITKWQWTLHIIPKNYKDCDNINTFVRQLAIPHWPLRDVAVISSGFFFQTHFKIWFLESTPCEIDLRWVPQKPINTCN